MPGAPGQHIALAEQPATAQPRRRFFEGVEGQVDLAAFQLPADLRRRQFQHRQAAARRLAAKTGEDRQEDRRLGVVGGGDAPGMPRLRRIERRGRRHRLLQGFQGQA